MKKHFFYTLIGGFLLIISFLFNDVQAQGTPGQPYKKMWAKSFLNQKAPDFVVEKWLSEQPATKGKFIMIDFWATWCGPCKKAIPELNKWHEKYGKNMVVVGLSDETEQKVTSMKTPVIGYYSAIDTQKRLKSTFAVSGIPHVVVIDPKGIVRWEGFPFLAGYELTDAVLEDLFKKYGE
jgi:cytochrome c biogenesis protein CcmG/thiol:disulfide interchange protein DsbE